MMRPNGEMQYLRALIADLADALGQDPVTGAVTAHQASVTSRFVLPTNPVLRNL